MKTLPLMLKKKTVNILSLIICISMMQTTFGQMTIIDEKRFQAVLDKTVDGKKYLEHHLPLKRIR
jgi:hypothetical protein